MYFTKVELHNFGIYKGTHEMCLEDKRGERNITLVGGLNGRGKTTFHDAILLALYGKQALKYIQEKARSYDRLLLEHINKHATDDQTYVAVSLCLDDGTCLRVKRAWTARGQKAEQRLFVEKDGAADQYLAESWSYYMEEILPFGIARFFFFNNEKITQLADDASFDQIKSSIKSAIGVSTIEKAVEHANTVIRRKKDALAAFEKSEARAGYQETEAQLRETDKKRDEAKSRLHELERRCEALTAAHEAKEEEFWASGGNRSRNRDAIEQEKERIQAENEKVQNEILQLATEASTPLLMCKDLVVKSYDEAQTFREDEAKRHFAGAMQALCRQIIERLAASGMGDGEIRTAQDIVREVLAAQLPAARGPSPGNSLSATSMMLYKHLVSEAFQTDGPRIRELIRRTHDQENRLMRLDDYISSEDEKTLAVQLYETMKSIESELTLARAEKERQEEAVKSLERQGEMLTARRNQLIKAIAEKENAYDDNARMVKYAAMSVEVLNAFKIRLQREKLTALSDTATACFKELVEKNSLVSAITIDPETLDIALLDAGGAELHKSQLSAGEQQMFAVAVVWALALTSGYKAPVIIDTPMARLDSSHRANFVTKYLPAASSQVLVLSTDEEVYGRYLELIRSHVADTYTLLYSEDEQCTSIVHGYFGEGEEDDRQTV